MNFIDSPLFNFLVSHLAITIPVSHIADQIVQILYFRDCRYKYHDLACWQYTDVREGEGYLLLFCYQDVLLFQVGGCVDLLLVEGL